jgi:CheY-like chemotaxis protein
MQFKTEDPIRALVIDDSLSDVLLLREALEFHSFPVSLEVIHDADAALESLAARAMRHAPRPDLIILDLSLPRRDGFDILSEVKQNEALRGIPVIIMSSSKADHDVTRAYALGANAYIAKPVSLGELMSVIRALGDFWFHTVRLSRQDNAPVSQPERTPRID